MIEISKLHAQYIETSNILTARYDNLKQCFFPVLPVNNPVFISRAPSGLFRINLHAEFYHQ